MPATTSPTRFSSSPNETPLPGGDNPVLSAREVSKRYGGVQALDQVDIDLRLGRIVALAGQNGAGKSTLVKIISGAVKPDSGEIRFDGRLIELDSVKMAQGLGIRVVHQVPALALDLNVAENVFLGSERLRKASPLFLSRLDRHAMLSELQPLLDRFAPDIDPTQPLYTLKPHERRLVGILKALANSARVLILDEPTAALPADERHRLLDTVRSLRDQGLAVLYVSHHLEEFEQLADEIIVLRDGRLVGREEGRPKAQRIVTLMLGREGTTAMATGLRRSQAGPDADIFSVSVTPPLKGFQATAVEERVSFQVRAGEIVILTGLVGSGATEIAAAAFGAAPGWSAVFSDRSGAHPISGPHDAIRLGIGFLPEDRINQAVLPDLSIRANVSISSIHRLGRVLGSLNQGAEREQVTALGNALQIRRASDDQRVTELSGGNQQKVMIARWLFTGSRFLILNEPTQGIDVIAKAEVRQILDGFALEGGGILIVSSDPAEFLPLCNRVLVMRRGQLAAELVGDHITAEAVAEATLVPLPSGGAPK